MADNKAWYDKILKNGLRRSTGGNEITESNPLDWERLRVLRDGKLIPFMHKGHIGAPSELDLDILREEAEKGNVFLYRLGEAHPQHLVNGEWYSLEPNIKDEKEPEMQMPEAPKAPPPFAHTLEDELKAVGLPGDAQREQLKKWEDQVNYSMAIGNLNSKKREYEEKVQEPYQAELRKYESERAKLQQEYDAKLQAWKNRVSAYDSLSLSAKNAIREGEVQRKAEILQNREVQRAAYIDRKPLADWYYNEFRTNMVRPKTKPTNKEDKEYEKLAATEGIDWSRMRIWDGEKFTQVLPEGHKGPPTTEALKHLRDAAQSGNLFMYQPADKYPSKWMGNHWCSMDKGWIDKIKPEPMKELPKPQLKVPEPQLEDFTRDISKRKLATHRFFGRFGIKVYQGEMDKHNIALLKYQDQLTLHHNAKKTYERELEKYNEEMSIQQNLYDQRMNTYESMLKNYETLTPQQKLAMEQDVQRRTEEIKQNKEVEKQKADQLTEKELNAQNQIDNAANRINLLNTKPKEERFVGGDGALGQNAYEVIAPHGYELPANSSITFKDAAAIHLALAGSTQVTVNQGLSPMSAQLYGQMLDGVLYGTPSAEDLQYITASYDAAKAYIGAYSNGDPKPLGEAMGEGLRNLLNVSRNKLSMSPEMAGLAKVAERIFAVLDKDQALLDNCTLNTEEMKYARGLVQLGKAYNEYLEAQIELTKEATGAQKHSKEQVVDHTINLVFGQTIENNLKNEPEAQKEKLVNQLGNLEGNVLDVAKETYKNDPTIQEVATSPKNLMNTNMKERGKIVSQTVIDSNLSKPKESPQVQQTVKQKVKEKKVELTPQYKRKKTEAQLEQEREQELVRKMLVEKDPNLEGIEVEDELVKDKLFELSAARAALAKRTGNLNIQLDDPQVLQEAADRAKVQEIINLERKNHETNKMDIFAGDVDKRLDSLRKVWENLAKEDPNLSVTDQKVIDEERQIRKANQEKMNRMVSERTQAARVRQQETGMANNGKAYWRSKEVQLRCERLKAARASLGEEFKNLPLDDMRVIQQDYKNHGIDPLKTDHTIVDIDRLTPEQKREYEERVQTNDYLRSIRTPFVFKNSRYIPEVDQAMEELKAAREKYEATVEGAKKGLPLNDPRIGAMHALDRANAGQEIKKQWKDSELEAFGKSMNGHNLNEVEKMAKQQLSMMRGEMEAFKTIADIAKEVQLQKPQM